MENTKKNTIDVVIPVYNGEKFILEALKSATDQTLSPRKVIVVDDGSTDRTRELVSEYARNSKVEIKLVKKENGGLSSARNAGIRESSSEFLAFLDADDVWAKDKLAEQMKVYQASEFKNLALVYCDYAVIDASGAVKYKNYKAPLDPKRMRGSVFEKLLERNQVAGSGSGVLIKREAFDTVGLFDESLRYAEDWDMWLRIAQKFDLDFSPRTLVYIRKHDENMTSDPARTFENELVFYNKWISIIDKRYPVPGLWSDKITYRILSAFPRNNLLKILKPTEAYDRIFKRNFRSFFLYLPVFFARQIINLIFYPKYIGIMSGLVRNKGK